jgi:uncharacterized protein DUF6174
LRKRTWLIGLLVLLGLCRALVLVVRQLTFGTYEQARQRWQQKGGQSYTLIVSEACFCPYVGDLKLTVKQGYVTDVEPLDNALSGSVPPSTPPSPSSYSHLTVENMLAQAGGEQIDMLFSPWFTTRSIEYDPVYGYVSRYSSDANGFFSFITGYITDSGYTYTAHDLQLTAPL